MFNKMTTFLIGKDDVEILDSDLLKTAALKLPDGIIYDPDFFYMKVRAVSAGEYWGCNKNFDFFPEDELVPSYKTFLTAHTFKNHENKDIKNAIGDVLNAEWNDQMKGVDLLLRIDRKIAPTIVRGFIKGFMTDVSMGCRISHSICSICGNKAKTKFEYCDHIKYQRGKVLDDGRKVYEINIGPKFHDISTVLNGAERAAKVTGLMIIGDKVAFEQNEELEKVASLEDSINNVFVEKNMESIKIANEADIVDLDMNIYRKMDKKAYVQKIAEIKKDLQGKILEIAKGDYINERKEKSEQVTDLLKILYEQYWNREKCYGIADKIKYFAEKRSIPVEVALNQFLKVLNFAGIELTPLELHDIFNALIDNQTIDLRQIDSCPLDSTEKIPEFVEDLNHTIEDNSMGQHMNLVSLFRTIKEKFLPNQDKIMHSLNAEGDPLTKTKAVIVMIKRPTPLTRENRLQDDLMTHVVNPLMPERSMHRNFLVPRLMKILQNEASPNLENIKHFTPVKMLSNPNLLYKTASTLPYILSGLMYATYEDERVADYLNGELQSGVDKYAEEIYDFTSIYKVAAGPKPSWGIKKALLVGIPATYAYSALQRARINNGKQVNTLNRMLAENPTNAALLQLAFAPAIKKGIGKIQKANPKGLKSIDDLLYQKFADVLYYGSLEKVAAFDKISESLYNKDIFKNKDIESKMLERYSQQQVGAIKQACVLMAMDRQDMSNEILYKNSLYEEDLAEYLKIAKDCIKIEIEKVAEEELGKQIVTGAIGDMLLNPVGTSALATLPGNIIDSFVFSKLFNKLNKKSSVKNSVQQGVATPTQFE